MQRANSFVEDVMSLVWPPTVLAGQLPSAISFAGLVGEVGSQASGGVVFWESILIVIGVDASTTTLVYGVEGLHAPRSVRVGPSESLENDPGRAI